MANASRPRVDGRRDDGDGALASTIVLLVEDDETVRNAIGLFLRHHGATVITAGSAAAAAETFDAVHPSLIISDIGLPDEDGCAMLAAVRRVETDPRRHVPAIAISGDDDVERRARRAGFDDFLAKPVEPSTLLTIACALIERR
jgi:DNA-binding response OmpR family regulator